MHSVKGAKRAKERENNQEARMESGDSHWSGAGVWINGVYKIT